MYPPLYNALVNPARLPAWRDVLLHPTDGPFYWERSAYRHYDRIEIPCYLASGWWAYAHMHLRGAFQHYLGIDAPTKLFVEDMSRAWRRRCPRPTTPRSCAGTTTGSRASTTGSWTSRRSGSSSWARTAGASSTSGRSRGRSGLRWYLRRWGGLEPEPEPVAGRPDWFVQQPPDETAAIATLAYASPPLTAETELTGPIALTLHAAIDGADDTNWIVALAAVAPDGAERELTRGFLKASHRALDEERSQPWLPYHPHLRAGAGRARRGRRVRDRALPDRGCAAPAARRLKLTISAQDHVLSPGQKLVLGPGHMPWHVCSPVPVVHRVYHDRERPSRLLLPIVPR